MQSIHLERDALLACFNFLIETTQMMASFWILCNFWGNGLTNLITEIILKPAIIFSWIVTLLRWCKIDQYISSEGLQGFCRLICDSGRMIHYFVLFCLKTEAWHLIKNCISTVFILTLTHHFLPKAIVTDLMVLCSHLNAQCRYCPFWKELAGLVLYLASEGRRWSINTWIQHPLWPAISWHDISVVLRARLTGEGLVFDFKFFLI